MNDIVHLLPPDTNRASAEQRLLAAYKNFENLASDFRVMKAYDEGVVIVVDVLRVPPVSMWAHSSQDGSVFRLTEIHMVPPLILKDFADAIMEYSSWLKSGEGWPFPDWEKHTAGPSEAPIQ